MSQVDVGGVGIDYQVTGQGRPVVLLHGFPGSARLWRHQVPALAEAGFQVIVPDLRGYGRSDKPQAIEAYSLPLLAADVQAILAQQEIARAHMVGHDWGAALAWALASLAPGNVDHLVALSVGNPVTFLRALEQRQKSWYMLLFQFPGIAEHWLTADNWANFRTRARHPDTDQVIADQRLTHTGPELVPRQHPAPLLGRATAATPGSAGTEHGHLEQRGLRPHRSPDDRLRR
jgi:pimeloyl-ACP methyl ester carboxylesterase